MADGKRLPGIDKAGDPAPAPKGFKERMYDKVKLPLWVIDVIIVLLVVALIAVLVIGTR